MPSQRGPAPSRWTLRTIRASFAELADYDLSGVWRLLDRLGLSLRSALVQQYSPDPNYRGKVRRLHQILRETAAHHPEVVTVFWDQMGYSRWPDAGLDWGPSAPSAPPQADRQRSPNGLWRLIGAMNVINGRVHYLDNYIVGRQQVLKMYQLLNRSYHQAQQIYVVQDNWSIHSHPDVLEGLKQMPRIEPVWLPTYAPWLNPIEKLWRWLRQDVLKLHRLASDFVALRQRVRDFLDQFADGSRTLLHYVGLLGDGKLAQQLQPP